jgi:hypothetical protein
MNILYVQCGCKMPCCCIMGCLNVKRTTNDTFKFMMILFVKLTKGIGHKFYQLMKSSPIYTINSHSIMIILSIHIPVIHIEIYCK